MSILDILEAHTYQARTTPHSMGYWARCACGWASEGQQSEDHDFTPEHRAHLAQVLEQHEREAKAGALEEAYYYGLGRTGHSLHRWIRDRAAQLKETS